ncbi:pentapeptide repeat-containing protein [Archangium lansingense]|uniref:Pentapeptide repeat-containing protein n=1 Tax=Archangium lansingense TaxID=2995310 RepID=A0ABT4AIA1_9BACT|nr:pentapeptide repeat-containing protein [Archangium lansinium]MCY1080602.1 pentapeptide repeat-containing protein [Archangium lansinium]
MLYNKVFYEDREIENERLELTDKGSLYFLGSNVTFRNCSLVLKVSGRNLLFDEGTRFIDCTFEVKQELKNHQQWVFASLKGCRFKGRLSGCDFGHWPDYSERAGHGSIENCDFSEARLAGCRFHGCDINTLRFPKWPCFTFLDPIGRAPELRGVKWPGSFGDVVVDNLHTHPPSTKALTYYAPSAAKRFETTPEELRAVIEKFDCIVY